MSNLRKLMVMGLTLALTAPGYLLAATESTDATAPAASSATSGTQKATTHKKHHKTTHKKAPSGQAQMKEKSSTAAPAGSSSAPSE